MWIFLAPRAREKSRGSEGQNNCGSMTEQSSSDPLHKADLPEAHGRFVGWRKRPLNGTVDVLWVTDPNVEVHPYANLQNWAPRNLESKDSPGFTSCLSRQPPSQKNCTSSALGKCPHSTFQHQPLATEIDHIAIPIRGSPSFQNAKFTRALSRRQALPPARPRNRSSEHGSRYVPYTRTLHFLHQVPSRLFFLAFGSRRSSLAMAFRGKDLQGPRHPVAAQFCQSRHSESTSRCCAGMITPRHSKQRTKEPVFHHTCTSSNPHLFADLVSP